MSLHTTGTSDIKWQIQSLSRQQISKDTSTFIRWSPAVPGNTHNDNEYQNVFVRKFVRCGVRTDGKVTGFAHRLHICLRKKSGKIKKEKDKNSVNICGGCCGSLRWAAICRLISTGYIIENFFPFPSPFYFNNLEKM